MANWRSPLIRKGRDVPNKIIDVINIALELTSSNISVNKVDTKEKYGSTYQEISHRIPDSSKAELLLNWKAKTQIKEGISNTIQWIKSNPWYLNSI